MKRSILNKTIVHFFTNFRNNSIEKNPSNFVNRPKKKKNCNKTWQNSLVDLVRHIFDKN